ncbi:MBL fold metallo-hydrolase [Shewanella sp. D64]|uniref:MBL fold metallo-hydrolase n=1 Tax=unclassified Shewanella TaxID=196818 RepID=UPI0022BA359B|nr:MULTISPECIES: MBL fold metallo-hydrolase [unclassified Shewanella]MEC4728140.1 MBL fold metallo-hydrolase [Shewanella sp. D64]MEC4740260.1 MBL fold metallo-hydrolase [Shewanella sp. E94]WBJ94423.1 MBL fold metallo-hydrolase [Shewanella sp. MTB7]
MKLTALVENTRLKDRPDLRVERGLSFHLDTMNLQLVFDTGNGRAFCDNAALLGIDMQKLDGAVISHRHHDHFNGVAYLLELNRRIPVFVRECETQEYLFKIPAFKAYGPTLNVGIDKRIFERFHGRFNFIEQTTEIFPNVYILTSISHRYPQPKGNRYLFTKGSEGCQPDSFEHELMMVVKEEDGLIVFSGCGHSGILNMLDTAINQFPDSKIKALVGGFHLVGLPLFNTVGGSKQDIRALGRSLLRFPVGKYYTGHCTGMKAYGILKEELGKRLEYLPTGRMVEI